MSKERVRTGATSPSPSSSVATAATHHVDDNDDNDDVAATGVAPKRSGLEPKRVRDFMMQLESIVTRGSIYRDANESKVGFEKAMRKHYLSTFSLGAPVRIQNEDARIYRGLHHQRKRNRDGVSLQHGHGDEHVNDKDDVEWDKTYGDGIFPPAFTAARLSEEELGPSLVKLCNGHNLSIDQTRVCLPGQWKDGGEDNSNTNGGNKVLWKALLEHCWKRAMHVASSTINVSEEQTQNSIGPNESSNDDDATAQSYPTQTPERSPADAKKLCQEWGVTLPDEHTDKHSGHSDHQEHDETNKDNEPTLMMPTCPHCGAAFVSFSRLEDHYYGTTTVRGCCWERIRRRKLAKLEESLVEKVASVQQIVVQSVTKEMITAMDETELSLPERLDWEDVVHATRNLVGRSAELPNDPDVLNDQQRMDTGCITPKVHASLEKRMLDRYTTTTTRKRYRK